MLARLILMALVLASCGTPPSPPRDAGHDATIPPRDAWFGDTNASDTGACTTAPTSADVSAILVPACATGACHSRTSPDPGGGLELDRGTPRSQLVGVTSTYATGGFLVIPGDPGHSFLWRKLTNDLASGEGAPMPNPGIDSWTALPADQLEVVRCWIVSGAP